MLSEARAIRLLQRKVATVPTKGNISGSEESHAQMRRNVNTYRMASVPVRSILDRELKPTPFGWLELLVLY